MRELEVGQAALWCAIVEATVTAETEARCLWSNDKIEVQLQGHCRMRARLADFEQLKQRPHPSEMYGRVLIMICEECVTAC